MQQAWPGPAAVALPCKFIIEVASEATEVDCEFIIIPVN